MGTLRILSGTLRGRTIRTLEGEETRPLLSRLRKSLVDILRPRLAGARVLDLFGGSGAIAFEFLSNGAADVCVVEKNPLAANLIRANAAALDVAGVCEVLLEDALEAVPTLARAGQRFDVVMVAPPYGLGLQRESISALAGNPVVAEGGTVIVQRDHWEALVPETGNLLLGRTRAYGRTVFDFYDESPAAS